MIEALILTAALLALPAEPATVEPPECSDFEECYTDCRRSGHGHVRCLMDCSDGEEEWPEP